LSKLFSSDFPILLNINAIYTSGKVRSSLFQTREIVAQIILGDAAYLTLTLAGIVVVYFVAVPDNIYEYIEILLLFVTDVYRRHALK